MADNTKQIKNAVNAKRQAIATEEAQRAGWAGQVSCAPRSYRMVQTDIV